MTPGNGSLVPGFGAPGDRDTLDGGDGVGHHEKRD